MNRRARIIGTGHALPEKVLTNVDLEKMVDTSDEWITQRTGIKERRVIQEGERLSDLIVKASKEALKKAQISPEKLDLILLATVTQEQLIPATACLLQARLGARHAAAFDFQAGCTGFIYGLSIGDQFIRSGKYDTILVVGAEVLSRYVNWQDRTTCVLFADGAGAVVLQGDQGDRGILDTGLYADGNMYDLICMPGGGSLLPPHQINEQNASKYYIHMKGNETFKIAVRTLAEVSQELLNRQNLKGEDVDWAFFHQANIRIIRAVAQRLHVEEEKIYINIQKTGNTSSASIPIALNEAVEAGLVKENQILLMTAFGAGLTWGAGIVRW